MKKLVLATVPWIVLSGSGQVFASVQLKAPQSKAGAYADSYSGQALGHVIASSDGRFILYEWGRPYLNWVPDTKWMAPSAARRLQTFLFKAEVTEKDPTSEYLFYPNAGCTYWLGDLSPDNKYVVLFELDHDNQRVRAGVFDLSVKDPQNQANKVRWFAPRVDEGRIEGTVAWVSNDEFIFPVKDSKNPIVRASVINFQAEPCTRCGSDNLRQLRADAESYAEHAKDVASHVSGSGLPAGFQLITGSANGFLAVYAKDDKDVLSLLYKEPEQPAKVLFENSRHFEPFKVPQPPPPASPK